MLSKLKNEIDLEKQRLDNSFGDLCAAENKNQELFSCCCTCAERLQYLLREFEYQVCKKQKFNKRDKY